MKKLALFLGFILASSIIHYFTVSAQFQPLSTPQGGTGATTTPLFGQVLVGTENKKYIPIFITGVTTSTVNGLPVITVAAGSGGLSTSTPWSESLIPFITGNGNLTASSSFRFESSTNSLYVGNTTIVDGGTTQLEGDLTVSGTDISLGSETLFQDAGSGLLIAVNPGSLIQ